ncbi:hypothetical protein [Microbaculum marinisediminis]|uniref:CheA signal transduction histidine kinase n=1 Tax=Microbaculum marinisediminis TaxID=2931392 RepID=A0AAW5QXS1_9HYPH|nr:hypothetical protein [Microbaculum sp. A6E488]MCT8971757.1 hypothetical protein [Microbaculum sp. A6E488]
MADFVSVLRRAVANLENNTEAARHAIYDKARAALRAQLEAIDPPLGPDDIARQIDSLDTAVGELETEFAPQPKPLEAHEAFQSAVSESGTLGGAASTAAREARETLDRIDGDGQDEDTRRGAGPSGMAPPERREPSLGAPPPPSAPRRPAGQPEAPKPAAQKPATPPASSPAAAQAPARAPAPAPAPTPAPAPAAAPAQAPAPAQAGGPARQPAAGHQAPPPPTSGRQAPPAADLYDEDDDIERGGSGRFVAWGILLLVIVGIVGVGFWQREALTTMITSLSGSQETTDTAGNGKIADRVPGPGEPATEPGAGQPTAAPQAPVQQPPSADAEGERVAQALLIEESAGGVSPASTLGGSVDWKLVDDTEAVGGAEKVIRGDVSVPERDLKVTVTVRRNKDQALPASHLIELVFQTGPGFTHDGIASIPGLIMKATPRSTGQPLVGAVVPVMDNYFLIGLSQTEIDQERNVQEITARDFIDIPVSYKDGGRAVLSLAKGESGKAIFQEAFSTWGAQ